MKKIETLDIKKKTISYTKTKINKIKTIQITKQMIKTQMKNKKKNVRNLKIYTPQITQWIN